MAYNGLYQRPESGDVRVQTWKTIQSRSGSIAVGAGAQVIVTVVDTPFTSNQVWLLGANNVMGFWLTSNQFSGALQVEISHDGNTFVATESFPITGESVPDAVSGIELIGYCARFSLCNSAAGVATMNFWLEVRSF